MHRERARAHGAKDQDTGPLATVVPQGQIGGGDRFDFAASDQFGNRFEDAVRISASAPAPPEPGTVSPSVQYLGSVGIPTGYQSGDFRVQRAITGGEVAKFMFETRY